MEHDFIIIDDGVLGKAEDLLGPIAQYLRSAAGRAALAGTMIAPIRTRLDYAGIARKAFPIQELPENTAYAYFITDPKGEE